MNNRLQQFLELENLTPARLADIIGVQRSGMSHILSGRNKPGFDFIHKLLIKFPDISADWFITGKGKPYKEMNRHNSTHSQDAIRHNTSPSVEIDKSDSAPSFDLPIQDVFEKSENNTGLFDSIEYDSQNTDSKIFRENSANTQNTTYSIDNEQVNSTLSTKQLNENQINAHKQEEGFKKRSVKRVIIFYNDGSFEELFPWGAKGC